MSKKKTEVAIELQEEQKNNTFLRGIMGLGLMLIVISIAYSSYTVWFGVDGTISKIMLAPQIAFMIIMMGYAFWKLSTK